MQKIEQETVDYFELAKSMDVNDVHLKYDAKSGLTAIIAIHSTSLGPSLGGCRFVAYPSTQAAIYDAMRLAKGMSYKAAISGLSLGGGKAVIIKPDKVNDRTQLFSAFGDFVNELSGRYITAVDSGTNVNDMDVIAARTPHVRSTSVGENNTGDPSPFTALGVKFGIEAAVKSRFGREDLSGLHVVIQGVGHVGYFLAKELSALGARLTYCDVNEMALKKVVADFPGDVVGVDELFATQCDIFAPCALGGAINSETVNQLRTHIVAGAANNQLASSEMAKNLQEKDILYVPDYVANAGGLIQIALVEENQVREKIAQIYSMLLSIFDEAEKTHQTTAETADSIAKKIIEKAGTMRAS